MHVALAILLTLASADALAAPADASSESSTKITSIILVAGPLAYRELDDALRIRLPRLRTLPYEARSFDDLQGEPYAYVELSEPTAPPGAIDISVILADGRSYGRRLVPDETDPVRDTATMLANMIAAIEEERVQPIRDDVDIPRPVEDTAPEDTPKTTPTPASRKRWSIGLTPSFGTVVGLAPTPVGTFGGGSIALDLAARAPIGAVVAVGARYTTRDSDIDIRLSRVRILLAAGWALRHRSFELLALVGFSVEPWLLSSANGDPAVADDEPIGPLLGGLGRVSPGYLLQPKRTPNFAMRLGLFAELAGSAMPGYGAPRLVVVDGNGTQRDIARFGGLELGTGVDATFWFAVPRVR
jgi:hypothetical protein